jgi:hypothetical protein
MVRQDFHGPMFDVVPHAIFWRPILYFTTVLRQDEDDLDEYKAAFFRIGNRISYDLRCYAGHPNNTTTMYLPFEVDQTEEIDSTIATVVESMAIPQSAIAWKRGDSVNPGVLNRQKTDRLREPEARILALKIASERAGRSASTEEIKDAVSALIPLTETDLRVSPSRGEPLWRQIVGNVISHRNSPNSPFLREHAVRTKNGLTVTAVGIRYLNNLGFSSRPPRA